MVFPSLPLYLDPPNWNQQVHQPAGTADDVHQLPQPPAAGTAETGPGLSRPGSMAERARQAKIPQPEAILRCPRCDSNNTKFCYFNNYSLTQPRHFCKTCRRYWTRGGALRNVPVGGGCRRNKRSSKSSAATTSSSSKSQPTSSSSITTSSAPPAGNLMLPPAPMSFMAPPWHQLQEYGFAGPGLEQWRIEQMQKTLPYLGGMEASAPPATAGMYSFHEGERATGLGLERSSSSQGVVSMPRQFWNVGNGGGWMSGEGSGFGSSSTGNGNLL